ncbi:MAG TPA: alkaline phosphatase family protein [Bacteroidia bacterium]|jgi:hypothetical protein|nr:alkaline phosphatase family protein [Bacteroidia bacterium]
MKSKLLTLALAASFCTYAQTVPTPDHVVVLMMENYGYNDIVGNTNAPYLNSLISDPNAALFTNSLALGHPSQPNYVMLFSGGYQGITNDNTSSTQFTTCNLGASLIAKGLTFKGFSEGLPSVGSLVSTSGTYARKHCPWTNWQGTGTNQLPSSVGQPFTAFPSSTTYSTLPTVSFVIPDLADDMHNPTSGTNYTVTAISNGDTWVNNNISSYVTWAKTHNSLLIITFDEDDGGTGPNQIFTMFIGQQVQGGSYSNTINHYSVLRTIQQMYGASYCDSAAFATPITNVWKATTGIEQNKNITNVNIWPVPAKQSLNIDLNSSSANKGEVSIYDVTGRLVKQEDVTIKTGDNNYTIDIQNINSGMYMIKVSSPAINFCKKIIVE